MFNQLNHALSHYTLETYYTQFMPKICLHKSHQTELKFQKKNPEQTSAENLIFIITIHDLFDIDLSFHWNNLFDIDLLCIFPGFWISMFIGLHMSGVNVLFITFNYLIIEIEQLNSIRIPFC